MVECRPPEGANFMMLVIPCPFCASPNMVTHAHPKARPPWGVCESCHRVRPDVSAHKEIDVLPGQSLNPEELTIKGVLPSPHRKWHITIQTWPVEEEL
jgi:hypothetical protein